MKNIFFIIFFLLPLNLFSFGIDLISSPIIISNAEIYLLSNSPETAFYQPAKNSHGLSLSHSNPHGIRELNVFHLASQYVFLQQSISAGFLILDNDYMSDKILYAGYGKELNNITIAANVKYYNQSIDTYKTLNTFTLNLGSIWKMGIFSHGLSYSNITHTSTSGIALPTVVKYECSILPFDSTNFAFSLEKEKGFDIRYGFGALHKVSKIFSLNTGFLSNPNQFTAGMIVTVNSIDFSIAMRTHQFLGYTQAVGVVYRL